MSDQSVQQQWKREPCDSNAANCNYYGKSDVAREPSSSSFSLSSVPSNLSTEMYPQQLQQHLELQKFSNISKINTLAKISGLDGVTQMPEDEKLRKVQQIVEAGVGDHAKQQILQILDKVSLLKPPERLLLYLRMPSGTPETDPLRQPQNPLGTRSEINHTINWVRSHLEHDPKVSIPKQDVYNDYIAYCERVDIKPLSTADFGKVMKQVFPEIRPRRLGTRGHSRYCYAAMRKATKLDPPCLPDLGVHANAADFNGILDEDSWKIIKLWAEGLLNSSFDSLKDLASHITKHHLNTPASNSSRLLLQKKLLQREAKEKRKFAEASPVKKRRKKKRRSSSSSESVAHQGSSRMEQEGTLSDVKTEVLDTIQQQSTQVQQSVAGIQPSQQMLPMNLVTEHDTSNQRKTQGTNIGCDNNLVVGCSTKNLAQNLSPIHGQSNLPVIPQNLIKQSSIKEEMPDDYNPNMLCKKVRQAHQAKGLWNPSHNIVNPSEGHTLIPSSEPHPGILNYSRMDENIMGPPAQLDMNIDGGLIAHMRRAGMHADHNKSASPLQLRTRKLRYLQAKLESSQEEHNDNPEKDVLPENFGIPRERVISICNMDKHELDDYLNGEDNSQDQEAELLQYFQPEDNEEKVNSNGIIEENQVSNSSAPSTGAYGFVSGREDKKSSNSAKDQDQITQLRHYLHQNLQTNKDIDSQTGNKMHLDQSDNYTGLYSGPSASASLTMMSQRHVSDDQGNLRCCNMSNDISSTLSNNSVRGPKRKINLNARSFVPNSPNTRRKNFSFVPISPNAPPNSVDYSPFVSPRSTPVVRKPPPLHKQQSLPLSDHGMSDPMLSGTRVSLNKSISINAVSASAPPSPSLVQQRFHFTPSSSGTVVSISNGGEHHFNNFQPVSLQSRIQNLNDCSLEGMVESRSQSVPLHCRSPAFNQSGNFPGFSSACSSVAQTPVPPEFADFSDPSTILDIFSDTSQHHPVKIETTDMSSALLDVDIASNESGMNELLCNDIESKVNSISRSVPSTPLPIYNYKPKAGNSNSSEQNRVNKLYDLSKSVPTTPIGMNMTPFRYSPEYNRDFLINGNTVESTALPSYYNKNQPTNVQQTGDNSSDKPTDPTGTLNEGIEELSNFGDVTESIIGTDLLGNL